MNLHRRHAIRRGAILIACAAMPYAIIAAAPAAPATTAAAAEGAKAWPVGSAVEVKWGGLWRKAHVVQRRGGWALCSYDGRTQSEWIEPWRIRAIGDSADPIAYADPHDAIRNGKPSNPPTPTPGAPPADRDAASVSSESANSTTGDGSATDAPKADGTKPNAAKADADTTSPIDWKVLPVDLDNANEVVPVMAAWSYKSAGTGPTTAPARAIVEHPIALRGDTAKPDADPVRADFNGTAAMFVYDPLGGGKQFTVETFDLAGGRQVFRGTLPVQTMPMTVSADGKRVAGRGKANGKEAGTDDAARVDVWDLVPVGSATGSSVMATQATNRASFAPYTTGSHAIEQIFFVDGDHLLTVNADGQLAEFTIGSGTVTADWQVKLGVRVSSQFSPLAVSPDHHTVIARGADGLLFINAGSGEVVGAIELNGIDLRTLAFSPDGKRAAVLNNATLVLLDLVAGKRAATIGLPPALLTSTRRGMVSDRKELRWFNNSLVWFGSSGVTFDVDKHAVLAEYLIPSYLQISTTIGDRFLAVVRPNGSVNSAAAAGTGGRALTSWRLPAGATDGHGPLPTAPKPLPVIELSSGGKVTLDASRIAVRRPDARVDPRVAAGPTHGPQLE